jgi:hypothetical protein
LIETDAGCRGPPGVHSRHFWVAETNLRLFSELLRTDVLTTIYFIQAIAAVTLSNLVSIKSDPKSKKLAQELKFMKCELRENYFEC